MIEKKNPPSLTEIFTKAAKRAVNGGIPGAAAMVVQVCTLMPMRTTLNYQYRHGGYSTSGAIRFLYSQGGIVRFYQGIAPALVMGPLSRFGDTAANAGMLSLLNSFDETKNLPIGVKTACASATAALWRINLTPIDTLKTIMQVEGKSGLSALRTKFNAKGFTVFYHGALAASTATFVGHLPWFYTHNQLSELIAVPEDGISKLGRNAFIGFCSSVVSDTCSNSIRVLKTTKQTSTLAISYPEAVKMVVQKDGIYGLFFRGLRTKVLANGLQGCIFSVVWKYLEEKLNNRN